MDRTDQTPKTTITFSGTLTSGYQTDTYKLDKLTPGSKYTAWTNNDTFGPGSSIDFVSLLGHPVSNFKITDINSLFGSTAETAFPIQLAFEKPEGSFKMREFSEDDAEDVPEPASVLGTLLALGGLGRIKKFKNRK